MVFETSIRPRREIKTDRYMKAKKMSQRKPGWGNVYNYGILHGDYRRLFNGADEADFFDGTNEGEFLGSC